MRDLFALLPASSYSLVVSLRDQMTVGNLHTVNPVSLFGCVSFRRLVGHCDREKRTVGLYVCLASWWTYNAGLFCLISSFYYMSVRTLL